jgi:hypothetical protein
MWDMGVSGGIDKYLFIKLQRIHNHRTPSCREHTAAGQQ